MEKNNRQSKSSRTEDDLDEFFFEEDYDGAYDDSESGFYDYDIEEKPRKEEKKRKPREERDSRERKERERARGRKEPVRENRRTSHRAEKQNIPGEKPAKQNQNKRKNAGGRRRKGNPVLLLVLLILLLGAAFGGKLYMDHYAPSKTMADLTDYFGNTDEQDVPVILQDSLSEYHARLIDGVYYMDIETVQSVLNSRFYYGQKDGLVLYTLPTDIVSIPVGGNTWSGDGGQTYTEEYIPARLEGETLYLALDFVKKYTNFSYEVFTEPNRMQIYTQWGDVQTATVKKNTQIRVLGGVKSDILTQIAAGSQVQVLETLEHWDKVKTADGFIGYIESNKLQDEQTTTQTPVTDYTEPEYTTHKLDGKVNMVWHGIFGSAGNSTLQSMMAQTQSVNVVAPTWFSIMDDAGDIESYAGSDYVTYAHENGWKVWAVVDNFNQEGVDHDNFLSSLSSRQNLISQLMAQCATYGIDGINVDFEQLSVESGQNFIEFIRELSVACRTNGLTLSVDNYVRYDFNDYYGIEEQAVVADYVVVMGYDEHYAGSQEAGSVASISYVSHGITSALEDVPADKLINGIPFYSRIWITDADGLSSKALGMQDIQDFITAHGMEKTWSDADGQYYAECTEDGTKYQIWIEDAESVNAKLTLMQSYNLAGVAEWKLGFETADIWNEIASYMQTQ